MAKRPHNAKEQHPVRARPLTHTHTHVYRPMGYSEDYHNEIPQ